MSTKIGKILPESIKRPLIKLSYMPEKVMLNTYYACANGKLWCPDKFFQKWDYRILAGGKLNFKNPTTYQEKLQWMKYYYHRPEFTQMVDKYGVREFVSKKIGEEYLVPVYGVYNSFDEINFDDFPDKFVLKCTHDSGSVVICKDKSNFDYENARKILENGLKHNHFYKSREWPYKNVTPRIICEKYLTDDKISDDTPDYKFFCFDGKVKFMVVNSERQSDTGVKADYYSADFERLPVKAKKYANNPNGNVKPEKYEEMVQLAEILSAGYPHLRVDFYYVNNRIYFGEITFYHGGGRYLFEPDEYNYKFGEMIKLPPKMR